MEKQVLAKMENNEIFVCDDCGRTAMGLRVKTGPGDLIAYPNSDYAHPGIALYYRPAGQDNELLALRSEVSQDDASDDSVSFFCFEDPFCDESTECFSFSKRDVQATLSQNDAYLTKLEPLAKHASNEIFLRDDFGHTTMGLRVHTKLGDLIAYPKSESDFPGIKLMFRPKGQHSEIKAVFAQVSQNDASDNEVKFYCFENVLSKDALSSDELSVNALSEDELPAGHCIEYFSLSKQDVIESSDRNVADIEKTDALEA